MTSSLTQREIERIWDDHKHLLWRDQQRALADLASDRAIKDSELTRIEELWSRVSHALDELRIDELRGMLTDMLRLRSGSTDEVDMVKEKYNGKR